MKQEELEKMRRQALQKICSSEAAYHDFLEYCSRGNINRFSFDSQLLLYLQKPDASMLAGWNVWNGCGNHIRYGQHGAHIYPEKHMSWNGTPETVVYDVEDTTKTVSVPMWELPDGKAVEVAMGISEGKRNNLAQAIQAFVASMMPDWDTLDQKFGKEDSVLYVQCICDTIAEVISSRAGLEGTAAYRGNFTEQFALPMEKRMQVIETSGRYAALLEKATAAKIRNTIAAVRKGEQEYDIGQVRQRDTGHGGYPEKDAEGERVKVLVRKNETGLPGRSGGRVSDRDPAREGGGLLGGPAEQDRGPGIRHDVRDVAGVHESTHRGNTRQLHETGRAEHAGTPAGTGNDDPRLHPDKGTARLTGDSGETAEETDFIEIVADLSEDKVIEPQDYYYDEYPDDRDAVSGSKTRYRDNVIAIRLLKQLEEENRAAVPSEQVLLARYVGWGGIPQAFDPDNAAWSKEYHELLELLSESEYQAARASTLSAFYTDPELSGAIWQKLLDMGFTGGNVLEPSMGIGNFYSAMPEPLRGNVHKYGVELDSISGRIAGKLHPSAKISIGGYEESDYGDNMFDLVIGNVPFGDFKIYDPKYKNQKLSIHNYFFVRALDSVRAGGIIAFLTSTGTLDAVDDRSRRYIAQRAELLGAVRLPTRVFHDTDTACDMIFLQKRENRTFQRSMWEEAEKVFVTAEGQLLGHLEQTEVLGTLSEWKCQAVLDRLMKHNGSDVLAFVSARYLERTDPSDLIKSIRDHFSDVYRRYHSPLTYYLEYDFNRAIQFLQTSAEKNFIYGAVLEEAEKHPVSGGNMPPQGSLLGVSQIDSAPDLLRMMAEDGSPELQHALHLQLMQSLRDPFFSKEAKIQDFLEGKGEMTVNRYFCDHPEQILGRMVFQEGRFGGASGKYSTCVNDDEEFDIYGRFLTAAEQVTGTYEPAEQVAENEEINGEVLPAPADQKNYTLCDVNGKIYLKENSILVPQQDTERNLARMRDLVHIKEAMQEVLSLQLQDAPEADYLAAREVLNQRYDAFYEKEKRCVTDPLFGRIMHMDVEYPLLSALEERNEDGTLRKADIFFKRTIHAKQNILQAQDPMDALHVSLDRYNRVDIAYMSSLLDGMPYEKVAEGLKGVIFRDPAGYLADDYTAGWVTGEEYLSGNVREKLQVAELFAEKYPDLFSENVSALKEAQPEWLDASQIDVRIGTPWIDAEDYRRFFSEIIPMPSYVADAVKVSHDPEDNSYVISSLSSLQYNETATTVYGTKDLHAGQIMERILNMRDLEVKEKIYDPLQEKEVTRVNPEKTAMVQAKAELLKQKFKEWFWEDPGRREKYEEYYNHTFNHTRLRRYDGSMLTFEGMNRNITLTPYQKDAVARILRGRNTLLSHCVGAGKTYEMQTGCMEMRRLGMISKALMVVPNHLTAQTAAEFLNLYPNARILLTRKKDFEKKNRRVFISKIATGDYDCVIMGESQFEKISMSPEYEKAMLQKQIDETKEMLREISRTEERGFTVKQTQKKIRQMEERVRRIMHAPVRDDVIYFENLGVDCLIVDGAHDFKNLGITTKMSRVAGVPQQAAQKAFDLYMKKCYVEEQGGRIIFATGTPISNTMAEMYVMMKYLYEREMNDMGIHCFDSWAACFGETVPMLELKVAGDGYRTNNRFAKFSNVPELMTMFRSFTDVVLPDMIHLPVPKLKNGTYTIVEAEPSEAVKKKMQEFVERSERIHNGTVKPYEDNMLKVSAEAKLLGTDIRLIDPDAEGYPGCKLDLVVGNIWDKYQEFQEEKGTQIVFSDIGTPTSGRFNVYDYIRDGCIKKGIPAEQIAYIHDADTEKKKEELFAKVRAGTVRVLIGSTAKMGTGMNVQNRVCAMHEVDIPWRPSDVEQREGRGLRQGNRFHEVEVFRYITKRTFDAYSYQMLERKQNFISQIMSTGSLENRMCEDIDDKALSFAEIKSIASDNPLVEEKFKIDSEVTRLSMLKRQHLQNHYRMQDQYQKLPGQIRHLETKIKNLEMDAAAKKQAEERGETTEITIEGKTYELNGDSHPEKYYKEQRKEAGERLFAAAKWAAMQQETRYVTGSYGGFTLYIEFGKCEENVVQYLVLQGKEKHAIEMGKDPSSNIVKLNHQFLAIGNELPELNSQLEQCRDNLKVIEAQKDKPFDQEDILQGLLERQSEINVQLSASAQEKHEGVTTGKQPEEDVKYRSPVK